MKGNAAPPEFARALKSVPWIGDPNAAYRMMGILGYDLSKDPRRLAARLLWDMLNSAVSGLEEAHKEAGNKSNRRKEAGPSWFSRCPRDEHGYCLPEGSAGRASQPLPADAENWSAAKKSQIRRIRNVQESRNPFYRAMARNFEIRMTPIPKGATAEDKVRIAHEKKVAARKYGLALLGNVASVYVGAFAIGSVLGGGIALARIKGLPIAMRAAYRMASRAVNVPWVRKMRVATGTYGAFDAAAARAGAARAHASALRKAGLVRGNFSAWGTRTRPYPGQLRIGQGVNWGR